jgi:hypothetical protein
MTYLPFLRERSPNHLIFNPIQFVNQKLGIPDPKFRIGDRVKYSFICDDKLDTENYLKVITNYGTILWMIPDTKRNRWEFCIAWGDQTFYSIEFYLSGEDQDHLDFA